MLNYRGGIVNYHNLHILNEHISIPNKWILTLNSLLGEIISGITIVVDTAKFSVYGKIYIMKIKISKKFAHYFSQK